MPDVITVFYLRQKPAHQLGRQHPRVELEDGPAQPQAIRHQADLLHDVVHLAGVRPDVPDGVLEVAENLREGEGAHLVVEPLVVEQDVVVQIFVAETPDQLEGKLRELPEVVAGELPLPVVEGERHRGHLAVLAVVLRLEVEGVFLYLGVPEGLQDAATVSSQKVVRHVGVEVEIVRVVQEISLLSGLFTQFNTSDQVRDSYTDAGILTFIGGILT